MIAAVRDRARSSNLLRGSAWILVGLGLQAVLGFAFWLLGARVADSDSVGRATALFTAIQFVNFAGGLGLTIALARHATDASDEADALFGWAVVATVASSVVGGLVYLGVTDSSAAALVQGSWGDRAVFCAYSAGTSIGLLVDVRLMAARRWGWLVGRIVVVGLVRLPFVGLDPGLTDDRWLYHLMLAPLAVVGVASVPLLARIEAGRINLRRPEALGAVARYSAVNWAATLSSQAPQFVVPLLVAESVPDSVNASFFLAWTVTGLVFLVPGAIAQVLLVEGSKDADGSDAPDVDGAGPAHEPDHQHTRDALLYSVGVAALAFVGSLVAGPVVAVVFGDDYDRLARLLPMLMAAGVPWAITSVRLSEARIRRDQFATVAITATLGLGVLVPALVLVPEHGTSAAAQAWVGGNLAAAAVAVLLHQRSRRNVSRLGVASG